MSIRKENCFGKWFFGKEIEKTRWGVRGKERKKEKADQGGKRKYC